MVRPNQMPSRGESGGNQRRIDLDRVRDDEKAVFDEAHRDDQEAAADAVDRKVFHVRCDRSVPQPERMMLQFETMRILNADQMREADRRTIQDIGIASLVLMENAGRQVVAAIESLYPDLAERHIAIVCGKGNNGGDGFVVGADAAAARLRRLGVRDRPADRGQRRCAHQPRDPRPTSALTVVEVADETAWELHGAEIAGHDLIIDAMFGIGLSAPLTGFYETVVADINEAGVPIVSIDIPSGMSADTPRSDRRLRSRPRSR